MIIDVDLGRKATKQKQDKKHEKHEKNLFIILVLHSYGINFPPSRESCFKEAPKYCIYLYIRNCWHVSWNVHHHVVKQKWQSHDILERIFPKSRFLDDKNEYKITQ